ncbi:uncharacterized protein LOC108224424 [Daucus carota subsp. sativus]|uniref:uncharacterized protein LOC108224424 n=1 Tax=Daucus carota subsp. sativus TaxID=79200 RepID=UPI0007B30254|nr:PREDICTED: uncharacterized protein LOC108224424 [Daucus carota subsp. sativus]
MGALSLSSSSSLLRHFLPPKPPSLPPNLLFKQSHPPSFSSTPLHTLFRSLSSSSQTNCQAPIASLTLETPENVVIKDDSELNSKETQVVEAAKEAVGEVDWDSSEKYQELVANLPSLSTKEKKELASYAHSLGKKLKSQQVGKGGVTDAVATALVETLEANELLKVKIHSNSPSELDDAVKQLEGATGSVAVGRIGRTVILYRPSLTKLKAEEKKLQARRVFVRRQQAYRSSLQNKAQAFGKSRAEAAGQSGARRGRSRASPSL